MIDRADSADSNDPRLATEPTENADAAEPTEPIDSTDPTEPIESTDPFDPMHKIEFSERIDHSEPRLVTTTDILPHGMLGGSGNTVVGRLPGGGMMLHPDRFQAAFWATKRAMAQASEVAYGRHGVRAGQQFILQCLWDDDCLTPGEVARRLGLATPTVTKAANRMEATGLLERRPHPHDARLVRLCLTERGRQLRNVMDAEMRELTERALATLAPDEREQAVRLLEEIRKNLSPPPGTAAPQ
jgi:DNA-binding MarR family transcriptional regulator